MTRALKIFLPLLLLMTLITSGCGSDQAVKPKQLTIAILSLPNDESIARAWYDEKLGNELGVKVVTIQYDSSALASNAMSTGNVDIAILGSATAAIGISKGLPYEVFWIHNVEGDNECLIAKNDADINSLEDLRGKRIGVPFGATTHYALLKAIQNVGISSDDVMLFDLQPNEIVDAWRQNQIDAAFVWQPTLEELSGDGHILIRSRELDAQGITTADIGVVNKDFARRNPDIVQKYVDLQARAHELYKSDPRQAASLASPYLKTSRNTALKQMNELIWVAPDEQISDRYLGTVEHKGQFVQTLFNTARFLEHYDVLDRAATLETFENAVNPQFAENAASKKAPASTP